MKTSILYNQKNSISSTDKSFLSIENFYDIKNILVKKSKNTYKLIKFYTAKQKEKIKT